jgi:hypothetical protein
VLIERGLRRELAASAVSKRGWRGPRKIRWIVVPGGLLPGLDVADRSSLHDWIRTKL